ncbi:hypothetical protein WJX79_000951 [Trebouxia sp. C0005]
MRAVSSTRRPPKRRVSVQALSTAQELLQDQLRKAQSSTQVLELVADQRPLLDSTLASTAVQKLAYLPRAYPDTSALEVTLAELAHAARCNMTELRNPIDMLAGFAELNFKCKAIGQLLETFVVHYDMSQHQAANENTDVPVVKRQWDTVCWGWADNSDVACNNLVTVAWAFGRLLQHCDDDMLRFMDNIAAELSKKLHNNLLKDAFTPDDLADTVDAFANVHDTYRESSQLLGNTSSVPTRNVGALLDTIAVDVRHQLSNKHSMRAPFVPSNLVKLLGGYARMGHISSTCSSMLDAAAGFVVRRMAAGHLNAVTKLSDLSQLLQAYATLGHQTVVMPELLTAASNQLRKQLASESERQTEIELSKQADSEVGFAPMFPQWGASVEPLHLVSTLRAYRNLGFHPSQGLLTASEPFLCCLSEPLPLEPALDLVSLFRAFTWQPGELVLQQTALSLMNAIALADPKQLVGITAGLTELRHLGYNIADEQLQQIYTRKLQLEAAR